MWLHFFLEYKNLHPLLFAKFIPNVLQPMSVSDLDMCRAETQQLQRDLLTHPAFIRFNKHSTPMLCCYVIKSQDLLAPVRLFGCSGGSNRKREGDQIYPGKIIFHSASDVRCMFLAPCMLILWSCFRPATSRLPRNLLLSSDSPTPAVLRLADVSATVTSRSQECSRDWVATGPRLSLSIKIMFSVWHPSFSRCFEE